MKKTTIIVFLAVHALIILPVYAADPVQKGSMQINLEMTDPGGTETVTDTVTLNYIKASEIEPLMTSHLSRYGAIRVNDPMNMLIITDMEHKVREIIKAVRTFDSPKSKDFLRVETVIIPVVNLQASQLINLIREKLSHEAVVKTDDNLNTLIITDVKSKIDLVRQLIAQLDMPVRQVMIEVKMVELNNGSDSKTGIDWRAILQSAQASLNLKNIVASAPVNGKMETKGGNPPTSAQGNYDITQNINNRENSIKANMSIQGLDSIIGLLINDGRAKIISSPRIVGSNNRTAYINDGEQIYYSSDSRSYNNNEHTSSSFSNNASAYPSSSYNNNYVNSSLGISNSGDMNTSKHSYSGIINAGISLRVTPHIMSDELVTLDIDASINDLSGWAPNGTPMISSRAANSTITVKNGEVFVMGGLKRDTKVTAVDRWPILGYIPVLDYIFASHRETKVSNDVVMFIIPTILKETGKNSTQEDKDLLKKVDEEAKIGTAKEQ